MARYSLTIETTSNATGGGSGANCAAQFLMPSNRDAKLVAVLIKAQQLTNTQESGQWVVDRISAVSAGSTLVPAPLKPLSPASAITDTTKTVSSTLGCANTAVNAGILQLTDGWNYFTDPNMEILAGNNQGFAVRRATAPTGAQVVDVTLIWDEV